MQYFHNFGLFLIFKLNQLIFGIGTDIIEVDRILLQLTKTEGLKSKLFTEEEIKYCESKRYPEQHFAGRFAAKEAFFKALGTGWGRGFAFDQLEIVNNESGNPDFIVNGKVKEFLKTKKITKIHVSISHLKKIANAFVILEY